MWRRGEQREGLLGAIAGFGVPPVDRVMHPELPPSQPELRGEFDYFSMGSPRFLFQPERIQRNYQAPIDDLAQGIVPERTFRFLAGLVGASHPHQVEAVA